MALDSLGCETCSSNTTDDFRLCDKVFGRLMDKYGNKPHLGTCPEQERVVLTVWGASGLIGNGGFRCLLEGYHSNDPSFVHTADSFQRIGSNPAHESFQKLIALFPNGVIPTDFDTRHQLFDLVPEEIRDEINMQFWHADDQTETLLAQYIRQHADAFRTLIDPTEMAPD